MLKYALWADRITTKKAIGSSPFQLVYGNDVVFLVQLGIPVMKFFQDSWRNLMIFKGEFFH